MIAKNESMRIMTEPTTSDIEALPEKIAHPVAAFPQNELIETVHA